MGDGRRSRGGRRGAAWALAALLAVGAGSGGAAAAPAAPLRVPSAADVVLGPGDVVRVEVFRHADAGGETAVGPDGTIILPLVGPVRAEGMTHPELQDTLRGAYAAYLERPELRVELVAVRSQKVLVVGEVAQPAALVATGRLTLVEALARTGGISPTARTDNVLVIRGGLAEPALLTVDVRAILAEGRVGDDVVLQRGDIVVVPARTITRVARAFRDVQGVLAPVVAGSAIWRNAVGPGAAQGTDYLLLE